MRPYTHRKWLSLALSAILLVTLVGSATQALANLSGSTFEGNDGNMVVTTAGNTDWANVANPAIGIDKPSGSTDDSFGQGPKEDDPSPTIVTGSIPPNKNDLTRFYVASEFVNNASYLYLGWERLVNIGAADIDFEINKLQCQSDGTNCSGNGVTPLRSAGDLLVLYEFSGSGTPTIQISTWVTTGTPSVVCESANTVPCWGHVATLNASQAEAAVNTVNITDPLNNNATLTPGLFGEAAINLTAAGVFPAGTCEHFGSAYTKARTSGTSFTSSLKDFIAPQPVNISNCGAVTIIKHTDPRGINQSFSFTSTIAGTSLSCTSDTTPASFTLNDNGNSNADSAGNTETCTNVPVGSYTVTEGAEPAHYTLESLSCSASGGGSGSQDGTNPMQANISVQPGGTVTCTYTNQHNLAAPSIATTLSATSVLVGSTVHDSSTLSNATADAGGTVTYTVYSSVAACGTGTGGTSAGTKTVTNGVVPDSDGVTFNTAGDFYWQAVYSGDFNNTGASSGCSLEHLVVQPATPAMSTAQNLLPNDSATLSSGFVPTGTITFKLFNPSNSTCAAGTESLSQTVNVNGNGTYSTTNTTFFASTVGTWKWLVTYSGDNNNVGTTSACGVEQFTITQPAP